ncbi:alcohol dehydrogenase 1-like [Eurosta solidaginis]|uniref:alcohol dehydrogenase 1-like n=1 Tax=Eurosta solidaginis TaxID=178769 RepID=UPI0035308E34
MELKGKHVIYQGGFGGIGLWSVKKFLERGVKRIAIFDRRVDPRALQELKDVYIDSSIFFVQFDITNNESITEAFESAIKFMGHFDVLVCGIMDDSQVERTINVNLTGMINSTFIALPYMDRSKGGRGGTIVNISSVGGLQPIPYVSVYSGSKHGVTGFTRSMGNPYSYKHLGVNFITICPGITDTDLVANLECKATFEFAKVIAMRFKSAASQSPEMCASNLVKVVETGKNGGVYVLDLAMIEEVNFENVWEPVFR